MKKLYIIALAAICGLPACKPSLTTKAPAAGGADFTTYIAVGNSLTAGFADNSLYRTGQLNSYPQRLSEQFKLVGGGSFKQPLLTSETGYPSPKYVLNYSTSCTGAVSLAPMPYNGTDTVESASIAAQGPYNNMGVPGIRCVDYLVPFYPTLNPYSARFFANAGTAGRALDELSSTINKLHPTFFSLWLGSNDVLSYATSGGAGNISTSIVVGSLVGQEDISPDSLFKHCYDSVLNKLLNNGAKGVLMNIPDVTSIPLFTTVPANGLVLRKGQADTLNAVYAGTGISFNVGANFFVVEDHNGHVRKAVAGELIMLTVPQDSITCYGMGVTYPIPGKYVLTTDEITNIRNATTTFNSIISQEATAHHLAYVDVNSYLKTLASGITFGGATFNAAFASGGAFSLDGVHLTPRGYAIVANRILMEINSTYGSTIPMIDVNKYNGVLFP